tara:strand:- start:1263 stop:2666 length:1404 start_codon:yes stop_codon:yes gene_type:complete
MTDKDKNNVDNNCVNNRPRTRSQIKIHKRKLSKEKMNDGRHKTVHPNKKQGFEQREQKDQNKCEYPRIMIPTHLFSAPEKESSFSRSEERYLSSLPEENRKFLISEMKKANTLNKIPIRFRILMSNLPNKSDILQRYNTCDSSKLENWIESLLSLPIGKLAPPPINSDIGNFLKETRTKMDAYVFGQYEAKDEIMRLLCQWSTSGKLNSFAIALEGPPGIGKTTFAKNVVAKVMNRPFNFVSLGGATDSAHLIGHSYTYEGAIPGKIAESLKTSKVMNPCFYFDELDKISKTAKGDEITNLLVHMTDREQNSHFNDRYFNGVHLDISEALFVFSYNYRQDISPVLLDRLNIIKLKSPSIDDKIQIAKIHMIPKALESSALSSDQLRFDDEHIEYIISKYTDESGVRNLEKALNRIVSTIGVLIHAPEVISSIDIPKEMQFSCVKNKLIDAILQDTKKETSPVTMMYN